MNETVAKKRIALGVIVAILFTFAMMFFLAKTNSNTPYDETLTLDEGWTLTINDSVQENVTLSETTFAPAGLDDVVTLEGRIPQNQYISPMLRIWMCHSTIEVYIDGERIYQFGQRAYEKNELIGSGYHWIALPDDCSGMELKLVFVAGEENAFTNIDSILLSEAGDTYKDLVSATFLNICAGLFLVIFGMGIIVVAGTLIFVSREYASVIYTGIFSLLIGTWTLCNKGDIQLISDNFIFNQYLEYFSLYLGLAPMLMFFLSIRREQPKRKIDFAKILIAVDFVLVAITLVLHLTKVIQFPMMVPVYHVFYAVALLYVILSCVRNVRNGKAEERLILVGIGLLTGCLIYDIVIFNVAKYMDGSLSKYMGITAWGGLAFVMCMMASYASHVYRGICSKMEKEMLLTMAYMDNLTKLANHAKYTQELLSIEQEHSHMTMIMFDLNELKRTNDTMGHSEGDMLLCSFAGVLKRAFQKKGLVARIGGDEFVVLLRESRREEVEALMQRYQEELEAENRRGYSFYISAAYGVASSCEDGAISVSEIAKRADERMYQCKAKMKKSR